MQIDRTRADAFALRMLDVLNGAFLAMMTSVGHRTGLFDTMAGMRPATSDEIARAAGLHERYVREWLGSMVSGRFVEYDPASRAYRLPPEHAASLTRAAGMANMASFAQFVPQFGRIEDSLVECFRTGGGVAYSEYPRFQEIAAEGSTPFFEATLLDTTLPLAPGLTERMSAGVDVADFGCGQGHAVNLMARRFPRSSFVGYDFSEQGIAAARAEAEAWGLANARFELQDVAELDTPGRYDVIFAFDAIHDQARPLQVLRSIREALREGGLFLMVDIDASSELHENADHPLSPLLYAFSCMHCMTVAMALGGDGIGTMWGREQALRLLAEAGFPEVDVRHVPGTINSAAFIAPVV